MVAAWPRRRRAASHSGLQALRRVGQQHGPGPARPCRSPARLGTDSTSVARRARVTPWARSARSSANTSLSCRGGTGSAAVDPGQHVLVGLVEQRLVAVELGVVQGRPGGARRTGRTRDRSPSRRDSGYDARAACSASPASRPRDHPPPAAMPGIASQDPRSTPKRRGRPSRAGTTGELRPPLLNPLFAPLTTLPGVGPAVAAPRPACSAGPTRAASSCWPTCRSRRSTRRPRAALTPRRRGRDGDAAWP